MTDSTAVRRFDIPRVERVLEGPGALAALVEEVDERGARRVAVLSGHSVAALPELDGLRTALGDRLVVERDDVQPHNPSAAVAEIVAAVRAAGADMVVAVGGGSPIDAAKLVAYALAEDVTDADALGRAVDHPPAGLAPLPVVAVPTTLSAAEWTGLAGLTVEREQTKHALFHPRLVPAVVVLDPDLARHTPRSLWTTTGVRAVDHAVETIYARDAHPFGTALCREALGLLAEHLPRAADDPDDREATLACQRAAELSALTLTNVSVGLSHAIGHQLGAAGVPHGVTSCVMLPHVLRFVAPHAPGAMATIATALGDRGGEAPELLDGLLDRLGVPRRLRDEGIGEDALDAIAAATMRETRALAGCPRPVSQQDVRDLLAAAL